MVAALPFLLVVPDTVRGVPEFFHRCAVIRGGVIYAVVVAEGVEVVFLGLRCCRGVQIYVSKSVHLHQATKPNLLP